MPDMNEVYDAMRVANSKGDSDTVRKLADYIQSQPTDKFATPAHEGMTHYAAPQIDAKPKTALEQTLSETSWPERNLAGAGSALANTYYGTKQILGGGTLSPEDQQAVKDWKTIEQSAPVGAVAGNLGMMAGWPSSTLPKLMLTGAALTGLQPSDKQGTEGLQQHGIEALKGAALAPIGYGIAKGVGRVLAPELANPATTDAYTKQIQLLTNEGIPTTAGQKLGGMARATESKLTSVPAIGDLIGWRQGQGIDALNKATYNRALAPIGEKSTEEVGAKGVAEVHNKLSDAYDNLAKTMHLVPDNQLGADLQKTRFMISNLTPEYQDMYDKLLNNLVTSRSTPQGLMSGDTLTSVNSQLGKEISSLSKSGAYSEGKIAEALSSVKDAIKENLARQNPDWAKQLSNQAEGWKNYAIIRDAAASSSGRKLGAFTPDALDAAVAANAKRQAGQVIGKAQIGEGRATMQDLSSAGRNVLAPAYPDSGSAGRYFAGMLGGGVALGTGTAIPAIITSGITSIPYLPGGSQLANALMSKRPELLRKAGNKLSELAPYAGMGTIGYGQ